MKTEPTPLPDACRRVELILSDVDGVLTDGGIWYDNQGVELKGFHIRDGLGIRLWQRAGFRFGVLTARTSHIVKLRTGELGIDIVRQGFEDKLPVAQEIARTCGLVRDGRLYKRYDAKQGKTPPAGFEPAQDPDEVTNNR